MTKIYFGAISYGFTVDWWIKRVSSSCTLMGISHHGVAANSVLSNQVISVDGEGGLDNHGSFSSATLIASLEFVSSNETLRGPATTAASRWSVCREKWSTCAILRPLRCLTSKLYCSSSRIQ